jgi:hypothetical protein
MLKSVTGIYNQGEIKLEEIPNDIPVNTKVIVTFLSNNQSVQIQSVDADINNDPLDIVLLESENISKSHQLPENCDFKRQEYHDLDYLAGTWTENDESEFLKNTQHYNQIDPSLW